MKCNVDGEVEVYEWNNKHQAGTLGFKFLPCTMKTLRMFKNALSGTIQLADLPGKIEVVYLYENQITGILNLDSLPATVRELDLSLNEFTGDISLENLPTCLEYLSLSENQLSANPTKGHLSVVGWTSTPGLGEAKNRFKPLVVFLSWRRPY